ncbi:MAG TPA: hypothetical protein VLK33_10345 [Terriglobales bacterium]|nr:hypothetical protein [Terriglobales bacterium]
MHSTWRIYFEVRADFGIGVMGDECIPISAGGDSAPGNPGNPGGPYGASGESNKTTCLGGGLNGCVTFGACVELYHCEITPNLPLGAKNSVPDNTEATLYIRTEEEGEPCGQLVCFSTEGMENPILYEFKGGVWVAVASGVNNGKLCVSHTGDGSFALVEGD